jgi:hypothetical protein
MRSPASRKRAQRGAIGLMATSMLIITLAFGAIATDVARIMIVRNELQNAADAAALAGASALLPGTPAPNWANGITQGSTAVTLNGTEGTLLSTGTAQAGYWDLTRTKSGLQAQSITPGTYDVPAVQVTVSRDANNNRGPVSMLMAAIFSVPPVPLQATAVAVLSAPGTVGPGTLLPIGIGQCLYNTYWDSVKGQPLNDPTTGQPYQFKIHNAYDPTADGSCDSGQWTAFDSSQTGASTVSNLITTGNLNPESINSNITFLNNGTADSIYKAVIPLIGTTVVVPVVSQITPGSSVPIVAFAAIKILDVQKGTSDKYILAQLVGNYQIPNSGGAGPYYGAYVPPRLAW